MKALVVGAGIAGLSAAHVLQDRGHSIVVMEKARRPGGRVATRHILNGEADRPELSSLAFDHGAQYFTARNARFVREVERWHRDRVVQVWHGKLAAFDSEGREPVEDALEGRKPGCGSAGHAGGDAAARHFVRFPQAPARS